MTMQGKINCGASSEPDFIQNYLFWKYMFEFRQSMPQIRLLEAKNTSMKMLRRKLKILRLKLAGRSRRPCNELARTSHPTVDNFWSLRRRRSRPLRASPTSTMQAASRELTRSKLFLFYFFNCRQFGETSTCPLDSYQPFQKAIKFAWKFTGRKYSQLPSCRRNIIR